MIKSTKSEHIFHDDEIVLRQFISSMMLPTLPIEDHSYRYTDYVKYW